MSAADDDQQPLSPEVAAAQLEGLLALLAGQGAEAPSRRVLELGCGIGRITRPLALAGHRVVGMDRDPATLAHCAADLPDGVAVDLIAADFTTSWPASLGAFDAICCLGNTLMTVWDLDEATTLLERVAAALRPEGLFVVDDLPGQHWPELTEGRWQNGVSEDGSMQLVWAEDDAVFALRRGRDVDESCWMLEPGEPRMRLWTTSTLQLVGRLAGLSAIERRAEQALLVMRRAHRPTPPQ